LAALLRWVAIAASAGALLVAACLPRTASGTAATFEHDFKIVAYQGEALLGGHEVQFSKVFEQGKPVVLNFFAGACPPCRAEMPAFQKVADELAGQFVLVGVDIGPFVGLGSSADARQLLAELKIRYPAAQAVDASVVRQYRVVNMPTTIFFRPDGTVAERNPGLMTESQFRATVQNLIGQRA
jgi:thiol-disulfide isomerase/thioredoxin